MNYEFICGAAGTGKTTEIRNRQAVDEKYAILCATTGIAGVNLDTITLNSLLGYYDTQSLADNFFNKRLHKRIRAIKQEGYQNIVIDEVSMMDGRQLDIIHDAIHEETKGSLGLVLTGDFCQLPPIKSKWAFEANCWPYFAENITRLTKVWRQENPEFLEAIHLVRRGKGKAAADILSKLVEFTKTVRVDFDGTTIKSKNKDVDSFNNLALMRLTGKPVQVSSYRWGQESKGAWKYIPAMLRLKVGAYVMILSNGRFGSGYEYANGDCGHIMDYVSKPDGQGYFTVKLVRTGETVKISMINRLNERRDKPKVATWDGKSEHKGEPFFNPITNRWAYGGINYFPLRLAYASTVHKTQGLTLDRIQLDIRNNFFGMPHMAYVALSRCRTPEGLRIIGTADMLAKRISVSEDVQEWL